MSPKRRRAPSPAPFRFGMGLSCYLAFTQMTYIVMSAAFTLSLT